MVNLKNLGKIYVCNILLVQDFLDMVKKGAKIDLVGRMSAPLSYSFNA